MSADGYETAVSEEAAAVAEVAREAMDRSPDWKSLAGAGLLSLTVPVEHGGDGLGVREAAVVLREVGRRALGLPVLETVFASVPVLAAAGSDDQRSRLLPGVTTGDVLLVPALREPGSGHGEQPSASWADGRLTGLKVGVEHADRATALLVTAASADGPVVVLVDPHAEGVTLTEGSASRSLLDGVTSHTITFQDAPGELLPGAGAARLLHEHVVSGLAVLGAGLVLGARDLTATYIGERVQFGRKLAEFQSVAGQVADVYITSRLLDLAAEHAVWRVAEGLDATDDLAVAAYWLCAEAPTALQTCHHLHGGMGVDETYPLHHYYSWVRDIAAAFGGVAVAAERVDVESAESKNLELTAAQRDLKAELRDYFADLVDETAHREMMRDRHGAAYQAQIRQLGEDGWMGVGWPTEYGGKGLGEVEQTIFANEAQRADVHLPAVTLQTVGPTLQRYGTQKQKDLFLQRILAGDVHFAIGYSEPDAGTDLAALRTTATLVDNGEDEPFYLVNGQKMWTTGGHQADYVWLAVRTDTDAPKHKGISILIVDTTDPGYSWTPIITADGAHHTNATYYNDVRVPADMIVGEENQGWRLITTQLNHERVMLGPAGRIEGLRDRVRAWAEDAGVLERPDVRAVLAEATATFRVNELLNWAVARDAGTGSLDVADASASKVLASERVQDIGRRLADIVTYHGDPADPATADLIAYLDAQAKRNLVLTFGGGVNEVQRELIAMFGLGLPRVPR